MAIIILCLLSPSPKHRHDQHRHRRDTLISIVASLSSRQLLLLRLSLLLSDKVKHYRAIALHTIKRQLYGSCQLPITLLQNMIISYNKIEHHVLTISHHNMPCKNKLDVLYYVVASFTWLLRASSKNHSYLRLKNTTVFRQVCYFNLLQGPATVKFDSTKVGETDTHQPPLCKTSCMSVGGTGLMCVDM